MDDTNTTNEIAPLDLFTEQTNNVWTNQSLFDGVNYNCTQAEIGRPDIDEALWVRFCNYTIPKCKPQEYYSQNYRLIGTFFQSIGKSINYIWVNG